MLKKEKGVTLIALVITIIVLLILAGVAIAAVSGDSGILTKAQQSVKETAYSEAKSNISTKAADAVAAYYDKVYAGGIGGTTDTINVSTTTVADYVKSKIENTDDDAYAKGITLAITGDSAPYTLTLTYTDNTKKTGTIAAESGSVTWND